MGSANVAETQPAPEGNKRRVAAFDLDGTLLNGQSGSLVLRYLFSHGFVPKSAAARAAWWGIRYKLHLSHRQSEVREIIFDELKHHQPSEIHDLMERFHHEVMVPRYRRQGLRELHRCHAAGLYTVIVSATFDPIAQASREFTGADAALATIMQLGSDGRYTGRVQGECTAGIEKLRRLRAHCDETFGPGNWVLERAYGDHHSDIALLRGAQQRFAVNASYTLHREASRCGWTRLTWY